MLPTLHKSPFINMFAAISSQYIKSIRRLSTQNINRDLSAQNLLDGLYTIVKAQRFRDIVVIQTKFNADPRFLVLADAFSERHLIQGTEAINKHYKNIIKEPDECFADISVAPEWNVLDYKSVVLHLFSSKYRRLFDIEQLWTVGEEYDDGGNKITD